MSKIQISTGHPDAGRIYAEELERVTAERDQLQHDLDERDQENDRLRSALNIQRIPRPSRLKSCGVDCEDCGDTGLEPCSRCAK